MTIYVIERLVKRKWCPLSFILSAPDSSELGISQRIYPCHNRSKEKAELVLKIATETIKDSKFRVSEYSRA
jgi:hypothetical protein